MTWRSLLNSAKPFFEERPETPPAVPAPAPPPDTVDTTQAAPASPVSSIGTANPPAIAQSKSNDSYGVFQLPLSPRSLANSISKLASSQPAEPTPPPEDKTAKTHNPNNTWQPPNTGFLLHQNPKSNKPPPVSTWFIDETNPDQPIATSPVKETHRHHFVSHHHPSHVDQQKARLLFSLDFQQGIARLEEERKKLDPFDDGLNFDDSISSLNNNNNNNNRNVQVFVRKRPLDCHNNNNNNSNNDGDFDVVQVETDEESSRPSVVVYHTEIQHDLRKKQVRPILFGPFASCFQNQEDTGGIIYQRAVKSLVETAKGGGMATLLLFGQSNSGKSYTMSAVEGMVARDIFTKLPYNHIVKLTCVELCGSTCTDLMDESPSRVRIADHTNHGVRFVNALSVRLMTPEHLLAAIVAARKRRKTNQSHLVYRITVLPPDDAPACIRPGHLMLVDTYGTDRSRGSTPTDATAAEIQASLRVLKECLKAKTTTTTNNKKNDNNNNKAKIPYADSTLTRCLRDCLEREDVTFHIIATVSAKATDTEDTLDTLQTVSNVIGESAAEDLLNTATGSRSHLEGSPEEAEAELPVPPKAWDRSKLCDWLIQKHLLHDTTIVPNDMTGRLVMKMTKKELEKSFYGNDSEKADRLYRCLRAESDRVARLEVKRRMALERSRRSK